MQRRSFLTLLVASPLIPALAKLEALAPLAVAAPPFAEALRIQRYVMGMASEMVDPGRIGRIAVVAQRVFRPLRFLVAQQSECFDLLHVAASGEPQIEDCVPAGLFSPFAFGTELQFDTVEAGQEIVLAVLNRGREPAVFNAAFIGDSLL